MRDSKETVQELCLRLEESTKLKKNGRCRKNTYAAKNNANVLLDSWRFQDYDYGTGKVKLPIEARGLFTYNNDTIIVRGYDKFFNVGEKSFTKEEYLCKHTAGPYDVTLKENGCIIFISGLPTGEIVVCSKHSTGERDDNTTKNHAIEGEKQLRLQIGDARLGELARYLYKNSLTAVAELCDDEFEEHVLAYPKEKAGLYIHGLNHNTVKFHTVPIAEVEKFAHEWGFKFVETLRIEDTANLFNFLHKCAETGTYNGREVEGFVIRCKKLDALNTIMKKEANTGADATSTSQDLKQELNQELNQEQESEDFFFKYKFEEPYLLYRQFREVTRQMLDGKTIESIPLKKHQYVTRQYLKFVANLFVQQPQLKKEFSQNHGIIKVRQLFLEHSQTSGMNLLDLDKALTEAAKNNMDESERTKFVFVPISTIGCGKTTVFHTLKLLFPDWGHVQNDDIPRNAKLKIVDRALQLLADSPAVLFDRNNSSLRERRDIFKMVDEKRSNYLDGMFVIKYVALNFVPSETTDDELWNITFGRVKERGDNHQLIKSGSDEELARKVMMSFIHRFQPLDADKLPDLQFHHVINMKLAKNSSLENVKIIIDSLAKAFSKLMPTLKVPSEELIEMAFGESLAYQPSFTKNMGNNVVGNEQQKKKKEPTFYGIGVGRHHIVSSLEQILENEEYINLQNGGYVQEEFHVTLAHIASSKLPGNKPKWKNLVKLLGVGESNSGRNKLEFSADLKLRQIVINKGKLICIACEIENVYNNEKKIVEIEPLNKFFHVTVGCFPPVKAVESNATLSELYEVQGAFPKDGSYNIGEDKIEVVNITTDLCITNQNLFAFF